MLTIRFNLCVEVESSCLTCYHIYIILGLGLLSLSWVCSSQKASKLKLNTIAFTSSEVPTSRWATFNAITDICNMVWI